MSELAESVRTELKGMGYSCSLVNARFIKPLDTEMIERLSREHRLLVTIEENVLSGGYGARVLEYVSKEKLPVHVCRIGLPDAFIEQGNIDLLRRENGLEKSAIVKKIIDEYAEMIEK